MEQEDEQFVCVGICMADPDSGYCLGCGRPPLGPPPLVTVVREMPMPPLPGAGADPDSPA
ncbi:MAG: hypothetical protein RIR00_2401 [Pseudomonadota bacterium]|jgi:hypothetical protein